MKDLHVPRDYRPIPVENRRRPASSVRFADELESVIRDLRRAESNGSFFFER